MGGGTIKLAPVVKNSPLSRQPATNHLYQPDDNNWVTRIDRESSLK